MSLPRYVIHIGPHKTGTTYLQASFRNLRSELLGRGVLYPDLWWHSPENPSHSRLAEQVAGGNPEVLEELSGQFKAFNASGHRIILISAEDLDGLKPDHVVTLKSLLDGASAEIVFYCRRWSELISSSWQERVKGRGLTLTLPELFGEHLRSPLRSSLINYGLILDRYTEAFGMESIRLVSYSQLRERGLDLVTHFAASFLGWANPPLADLPTKPNASLSPTDIEMIRALNVIDLAGSHQWGSPIRQAYLRSKPHLDIARPAAAMAGHISKLRFNEAAPGLHELHNALVAKYGNRLVPPAPRKRFFVPRVAEIAFVHPNYLLERGVSDALSELYEAICRSLTKATTSVPIEIVDRVVR